MENNENPSQFSAAWNENPSKFSAAWVGVGITVTAILVGYSVMIATSLDGRIDRLEEDSRALVDGNGDVIPSREALQSRYRLESLIDRLDRLESYFHEHARHTI